MPTTTDTVTAETLLTRYADDIAYVAEAEAPATDLSTLSHHLETAASNFDLARINGHEDIDDASRYVHDAHQADDATERAVFLRKADQLLHPIVFDMTREYRDMVGD